MKRATLIGVSSLAAVIVFGAATTARRLANRRQPPKRRARLDARKTSAVKGSRRRAALDGLRRGARAVRQLRNHHLRFSTA